MNPTWQEAVLDERFSHGRAGDRLYRGATLIYWHDASSPSGVTLAAVGPAGEVDALIRTTHRTSPLSPTEGMLWRKGEPR